MAFRAGARVMARTAVLAATRRPTPLPAVQAVARRPWASTPFYAQAAAPSAPSANATDALGATYQHILASRQGAVGIIRLNRPKALNALCSDMMTEINTVMSSFDSDPTIGAIVLTGSDKAFAAGADIKEMQPLTYAGNLRTNFIKHWTRISEVRKPIIAAVSGYALGGGCELAMSCDIIYASDTAKFGQPEIRLGTIPGAGGTQRLIRAIGKSRAMELCLTGDQIDAAEAERSGLVSKVVAGGKVVDEAVKLAERISNFSKPVVGICKEAVNAAYEMTLAEGLHFERRLFHSTFALNDQKEGMGAFAEKRPPKFTDN
jgi:enoyl-CoA hydratase